MLHLSLCLVSTRLIQGDLISRHLASSHLQRPFSQIRLRSQILGFQMWMYPLGTPFSAPTEGIMVSGYLRLGPPRSRAGDKQLDWEATPGGTPRRGSQADDRGEQSMKVVATGNRGCFSGDEPLLVVWSCCHRGRRKRGILSPTSHHLWLRTALGVRAP